MATRKKHIRTPYEDERKKHRAAASRHVLALEAQIKEDDKRKLFHIANDLRVYGNHLTNIAQKRVSQLFRTKAYREALKQYHNASSVLSSLDKGTPKYHEAKEKVKDAADVLERLQAQYKLTMEDLRHDMAEISKGGKIKAVFLLSETENVWAAVQSVLYKSGKHLNYAKRGELPLIRAKQIERGITLSFVDGVPRCKMGAIDDFALIVKKNDSFAKNELACIEAVAAVSETSVILENLAERNGKSTKRHERKERLFLRALDRSRRANNKDRYNEDGTVKKGVHKPWKKSKQYRIKEACLKELRRKNALSRKYANNELANRIRAMGDDITIERSNVKALQKKAKPSVPEQGKKQKRRKRFGHSILHRCPGHLYAQLHSKFSENHFHVVDNMYRASQYDHKSNSYNKKKLSQRWHKFEDGTKVQRDIYSAFLLLCHNDDFKTINQDICISKYETFKKAHDKCISDIKTSGQKVCNSGI